VFDLHKLPPPFLLVGLDALRQKQFADLRNGPKIMHRLIAQQKARVKVKCKSEHMVDRKRNPAQAKPGRGTIENSNGTNRSGPTLLRNYSRKASTVSSVAGTFWARSSASSLLSSRRYPILLPSSLIPDRK
jgi:hypothetical protein